MNYKALRFTMREMQTTLIQKLTPMLATSLIAGGVLSILAPFGTSGYSMVGRLAYWVGLCIAGGLGAVGAEWAASHVKSKTWIFSGGPWPVALWQSLGATASVSLFAFPMHRPPTLIGVFLSLFYIWVVGMVICSFGALQRGRQTLRDETAARPALYERLKPSLRSADIYALSAEDHYVRVITSAGDDLILMRLSDAIKEAAPLPGLSPHRSWWVAEGGTAGVKRADGKVVITLKNGASVPASRNGAKVLRGAGWL